MSRPLLDISGLSLVFATRQGNLPAVRDCYLQVGAGEILGLAGESGSGKTLTAMACLGLLPASAKATGSITLDGTEMIGAPAPIIRGIRGSTAAMIFQDPGKALNPFFTIGHQVGRTIANARCCDLSTARSEALATLADVRLPDPELTLDKYPHQFSGGQLQRIVIAMAIACRPKLLIADEPTTALDVTVQAQIVELVRRIARERNLAVLFITHDLALLRHLSDRLAIMYAGQIVETGRINEIFRAPAHPYTANLLRAVPHLGHGKERLRQIPGQVPQLNQMPSGCTFNPRCEFAQLDCTEGVPPRVQIDVSRSHACRHPLSTATYPVKE